jgi:hypothetical protein
MNHAETAHLDTPKERALRNDYDDADFEVQQLKSKLKHVRMVPLSEEAEAMFLWRSRCLAAEEMLRKHGLLRRFEESLS